MQLRKVKINPQHLACLQINYLKTFSFLSFMFLLLYIFLLSLIYFCTHSFLAGPYGNLWRVDYGTLLVVIYLNISYFKQILNDENATAIK
jgi:hypothetical protein